MTNNIKLLQLEAEVTCCFRCPRLVAFRETVPSRPSWQSQPHWRKPVPGFGDPNAWLLITGLAPSAQGGNRTGRIFTGDGSAKFLIDALYRAGFANQSHSDTRDDGLLLKGCFITASVKCVPPENKPTKEEILNCHSWYEQELALLPNLKAILALGKIALETVAFTSRKLHGKGPAVKFAHGWEYAFTGLPPVYACYHPSPQNTNTGVLTMEMMLALLQTIKSR